MPSRPTADERRPRPTARVLIGADDRTGALETAGAVADAIGRPVPVHTVSAAPEPRGDVGEEVLVVDLDSRHLPAGAAATRASELGLGVRSMHKIDSVLRGNWAAEVLARGAHRVLVVAAAPVHGRTCHDGVVLVDGVPVDAGPAGRDPRAPAESARPAVHLHGAGATKVRELPDARAVERWLRDADAGVDPGVDVGVADASTDADVAAIVACWAEYGVTVLLAGPAAVLGPAASAMVDRQEEPRPIVTRPGPILVVCGSLHPTARRQLETLVASGLDVTIETTAATTLDPPTAPAVVAAELADRARRRIRTGRFGTVVVLGGDTASALLGPGPHRVGGTLAPGMPWLCDDDGTGPLVLTRSGGFGDDRALVELAVALGTPPAGAGGHR